MRKIVIALLLSIIAIPAEADQVKCLAKNIYYEARNQSVSGMYAVAEVTLNRVGDKRWPNDICKVVEQRRIVRNRWVCQFSWFCDGKSDNPKNLASFDVCYMIAEVYLSYYSNLNVVPEGTYWYHNNEVSPYWASAYTPSAVIGDHIFYSDR